MAGFPGVYAFGAFDKPRYRTVSLIRGREVKCCAKGHRTPGGAASHWARMQVASWANYPRLNADGTEVA